MIAILVIRWRAVMPEATPGKESESRPRVTARGHSLLTRQDVLSRINPRATGHLLLAISGFRCYSAQAQVNVHAAAPEIALM
jgi:hypothetical protein